MEFCVCSLLQSRPQYKDLQTETAGRLFGRDWPRLPPLRPLLGPETDGAAQRCLQLRRDVTGLPRQAAPAPAPGHPGRAGEEEEREVRQETQDRKPQQQDIQVTPGGQEEVALSRVNLKEEVVIPGKCFNVT